MSRTVGLSALASTVACVFIGSLCATQASSLTPQAINTAPLEVIPASYTPTPKNTDRIVTGSTSKDEQAVDPAAVALPFDTNAPSASVVRLEVLLDRAGASPGVIDGLDGGNLRHAVVAFEAMRGLPVDSKLGPRMISSIEDPNQVIGSYVISAGDISVVVGPISKDYGQMAKMKYLGYTTVTEGLAERFHMGEDLLKTLNPDARFVEGETIFVADLGVNKTGKAVRLEVDKAEGQVRAYAADGSLLVAYPATIGSIANPSPTGTHSVKTVVVNPDYTYNPKVNFQQGANDTVLTLPPGPNGPVGTVWIDLSEPTFGIHGTPEPSRIDKTGSHGCVRLTNWDAEELARLLAKDVPVKFL
ncbi:L,D-transpeptidase [Rhizobium laguerreae]|uniref:Murein L,D-transpeptidase n=1 Tax=Rhizobium laguerreae TaxID=1076926 RepID=A0A7Y2RA41_9HYPH|nr:L,D-transpeptidase [Rhizobium laguerreae]NNH42020.1 murein L,D-transpeptidase [Rhizobium laguerreae]NNH57230.1 murein L,D-transpeptidase [Rhizobium laguerreae]NNH67194.1 murein L,D-transpeptidase [Rhizobium laguerreae]